MVIQETGMQPIQFDEALIRRYGGRGPRYTSYPTAVQFHEFDEAQYKRQCVLSNERNDGPLSLYLHIPYCHTLCYYCGCNKVVTRNRDRAEDYLQHLFREVELQSALFDDERVVEQLHLGGGTPTYLSEEQLASVMAKLAEHFRLRGDGRQEFSIEIDPRSIQPGMVAALAGMGFNRLSMGVQDFDPEVQKAVNRIQPPEDTLPLIQQARDAGFRSVSIDLIYGLPMQTPERFDRTLDTVLEAQPDRISVYSYAHLPQMFRAQRLIRPEDLPSDDVKLALLGHTIQRLGGEGYEYIGMDHFARNDDELAIARENGTMQRNFQGYSTHADTELIALGASSIGRVADCYSQHTRHDHDYARSIEEGHLPVERGLIMSDEDKLRGKVIQSIMCRDRLIFSEIEQRFDIDFRSRFADELADLAPLAEDGLVEVDDASIRVTPTGRLLLRAIAMVFDGYLRAKAEPQRFSKII